MNLGLVRERMSSGSALSKAGKRLDDSDKRMQAGDADDHLIRLPLRSEDLVSDSRNGVKPGLGGQPCGWCRLKASRCRTGVIEVLEVIFKSRVSNGASWIIKTWPSREYADVKRSVLGRRG